MVRSVVSLLSICFSSHQEANLLLFLLLLFLMKRVNKLEAVNIRSQSKRRFLGEEKVDVPQCTLGFRKERDHVLCCCYAKIGTWLGVCNTYLVLFHLSFEPWSRQILLLLLFFFSFYRFFPFNSHSSSKDILDVLKVKRIRSDVALTFKSIAGRNTEMIPRTNSLPF